MHSCPCWCALIVEEVECPMGQRVETVDDLEGGLAGSRMSCAVVGVLGDG